MERTKTDRKRAEEVFDKTIRQKRSRKLTRTCFSGKRNITLKIIVSRKIPKERVYLARLRLTFDRVIQTGKRVTQKKERKKKLTIVAG